MKSLCLILFTCLTPVLGIGQNGDNRQTIEDALTQYETLDNDPQLLLLERSLQKSEETLGGLDSTTTKVYNSLSKWHSKNNNFKEALDFALKHLTTLRELNTNIHEEVKATTAVGGILTKMYNFIEAERYYTMSMELLDDYNHPLNYFNYKGMSRVLLSKGDYNLLIAHARHAYELAEDADQQCEAWHLELNGHARIGDLEEADKTLAKIYSKAKAENLVFHLGRAYSHSGWLTNIRARSNAKENEKLSRSLFQQSVKYYEKSIEYLRKSKDYRAEPPIVWAYTNISNQYRKLNKADLAMKYAKKAVDEHEKISGAPYSPAYAFTYYNLATKYTWQKDYESAIRHQQNAIKCLLEDEKFSDSRAAIPKEKLYKVGIKWRLLSSLKEKAISYAHLYLKHKNKADAESAERHLATAVDLIDIMRGELTTDDTKVYWRSKTRSIYDTAIEISVWLGDKEKVLKYMEKSRSLLLLDELNHKDAMSFIPETLSERERKLRQAFADSDEGDIAHFKVYIEYLDSIKTAFPSYYKYKFDIEAPTIVEVQNTMLDDSTQIINYQITPDSLFILNITNTGSELITSPRPKSFKEDVSKLLTYLNNKDSLEYQHHFLDFIDLSHKLYGQLYGDIKVRRKNVIIIGDGIIDYVPFDVLISKITEQRPRYLIQDYIFSVVPSLAILQKVEDKRDFDNLLLVSPEEYDALGLQQLRQSEEEQKALERYSDTRHLSLGEATFKQFSKLSGDYDVIHFTTHSGLDVVTNKPWIAFSDAIVSQDDIYKMKLQASLVTLSSCKSIDGQAQTGEGVNSLARAFLFADASAVIGSAWNLNEMAGLQVMKDFYKSLKNSTEKSVALREAKLNYINANPYKSPYYWAPLMLIGDPAGLEVSTKQANHHMILFAILGLVGLVFLYKKLFNSNAVS